MPISFEDARSLILRSVTPLGSEMVTPLAAGSMVNIHLLDEHALMEEE